jgi:hypothetical protein
VRTALAPDGKYADDVRVLEDGRGVGLVLESPLLPFVEHRR